MKKRTLHEGHRGDLTEGLINATNEYLRIKGLALISKVPTPIKVLKRTDAIIVRAFFEEKGLLDYIGVCQGLPIAFDSKETNQISLPLKNIPEHQLRYTKNFIKQDGYAFIICHFKKLNKFYLIPGEIVLKYQEESLIGGRKSIPEGALDKEYEISIDGNGILNYLVALNRYYNDREKGRFKDKGVNI